MATKTIKNLANHESYQITNDNLLYQNTKTPWIRLASTVNINKAEDGNGVLSKLKSFGLSESDIMDSNLARNLILQGGTAFLEDGVDGSGMPSSLTDHNTMFSQRSVMTNGGSTMHSYPRPPTR